MNVNENNASGTLPLSIGSIGESPSNKASAHLVQPRDAAQSRGVHILAFLGEHYQNWKLARISEHVKVTLKR